MRASTRLLIGAGTLLGAAVAFPTQAQEAGPSFFVTSVGLGDGANLGGLEGADAHCAALAAAAGLAGTDWRAYLSTQGDNAVNARDRIGSGPWYNVEGVLIAENVDDLHDDDVNINHETALTENGDMIAFVPLDANGNPVQPADNPNPVTHDILTGTQADGTAFPADAGDMTCGNWTSNGEGAAMLGHADRRSLQPGISPWNAAHPSRGCGQADLVATGGAGLLYCFLAD